MEYLAFFGVVYLMVSLYALLMEGSTNKGTWKFQIMFALAFPVLMVVFACSEYRHRKRKGKLHGNEQN